jgi:hypothetical protein
VIFDSLAVLRISQPPNSPIAAIHSSTPPSGTGDGREGAVLDDVLDADAAEGRGRAEAGDLLEAHWIEGGKLGRVDADERLVEDRTGGRRGRNQRRGAVELELSVLVPIGQPEATDIGALRRMDEPIDVALARVEGLFSALHAGGGDVTAERLVLGALRRRHEITQAEHLGGDLRKLVAEVRERDVVEDDVAEAPEGRAVVLAQDGRHRGVRDLRLAAAIEAEAVLLVILHRRGSGAVVDQLAVRPQLQDAGDRPPAQAHREGAGVGVLIDEAALARHLLRLVFANPVGPDQVARHARVAVDLRDRGPVGRGADLQVLEARTFAREQEGDADLRHHGDREGNWISHQM